MTAKRAAAKNVSPIKAVPIPKAKPPTLAQRLDKAETEIQELKGVVDHLARLLGSMVEDKAVAQLLPAMEQQLRASIQQRLAGGGQPVTTPPAASGWSSDPQKAAPGQ